MILFWFLIILVAISAIIATIYCFSNNVIISKLINCDITGCQGEKGEQGKTEIGNYQFYSFPSIKLSKNETVFLGLDQKIENSEDKSSQLIRNKKENVSLTICKSAIIKNLTVCIDDIICSENTTLLLQLLYGSLIEQELTISPLQIPIHFNQNNNQKILKNEIDQIHLLPADQICLCLKNMSENEVKIEKFDCSFEMIVI